MSLAKTVSVDSAVLSALHGLLTDPEIIDPRARMLAAQAVKTIITCAVAAQQPKVKKKRGRRG